MQKKISLFFIMLSLATYGQKSTLNSFKLIVIKPEGAIIDKSIQSEIDTIQNNYMNRYYSYIAQQDEILNFKGYSKDMEEEFKKAQAQIKKALPLIKAKEPEIKNFRYYETLSYYSVEIYNLYFNERKPYSEIIEIPHQNTDIVSLNKLAENLKADYIVFFTNIRTEGSEGFIILKLTTSLYSRQQKEIIITQETVGDTNSRGDLWTCKGILSCLFINGVKTSTDLVYKEISKIENK